MTDIHKIQAVWSGFLGGPGVNTFYVLEEPTGLTALQDMYDDLVAAFPSPVTIQVIPEGVTVSAETGELTGAWSTADPGGTTGTGEPNHAGGTGATIRWGTDGIVAGRRVLGHTYLVPLTRGNFAADGQLSAGAQSAISTAAGALWASWTDTLGVWSRPRPGLAGSFHLISSVQCPPKAAQLRSRRD